MWLYFRAILKSPFFLLMSKVAWRYFLSNILVIMSTMDGFSTKNSNSRRPIKWYGCSFNHSRALLMLSTTDSYRFLVELLACYISLNIFCDIRFGTSSWMRSAIDFISWNSTVHDFIITFTRTKLFVTVFVLQYLLLVPNRFQRIFYFLVVLLLQICPIDIPEKCYPPFVLHRTS